MVKNKSYSPNKSKKYSYKKLTLALAVLCLLALGSYTIFNRSDPPSAPAAQDIDLETSAGADRQEAEQNKDRLVEEQKSTTKTPGTQPSTSGNSNKKSVKPTITEASRTSVRAFVTGVFEEDGTCTATFTKGSQTLTKTSAGFQNASYTQCAPIDYGSDFLSAGTWSVKVSYSSGAAEGTSDASTIE